MANPITPLDRLKSQLLTSGIQQTNQPLYQVINQLIDFLRQTANLANQSTTVISGGGSGGGSSAVVITQGLPFLEMFEEFETLLTIPGTKGDAGSPGGVGPIGPPAILFDNSPREDEPIGISYDINRYPLPGEIIDVPYTAGDYTALGGGTWTVDVGDMLSFAYTIIRRIMLVTFALNTTSVTGAVTTLQIKIPGGYTARLRSDGQLYYQDNGVADIGILQCLAGGTVIRCITKTLAPWTASVNNTFVSGMLLIRI